MKLQLFFAVADPAMELSPNQVKVTWFSAASAFADGLCMLATQPGLDCIRIFVLTNAQQGGNEVAPSAAGIIASISITNIGEKVTFQHIRRRQRKPAVVHCFEDSISVSV